MSSKKAFHVARQRHLIEHVARYRMTTAGAIAHLPTLPIQTVRTAKRRLAELVKAGLLGRAPLYRNRHYYHLTVRAVERLTRDAAATRQSLLHGPLSEPAKIRAYAMLLFCCCSSERRVHISAERLERGLPDLCRPGMPGSYYVARSADHLVVGLLRVDTGGIGRWDRIVRRIRRDIDSHWQQPGFRTLIDNHRFEMAVATFTTVKCQRVRQALGEERRLPPVPIRVVAIPELIHLIVPPAIPPVPRSQRHLFPARSGSSRSCFPRARNNNGKSVC